MKISYCTFWISKADYLTLCDGIFIVLLIPRLRLNVFLFNSVFVMLLIRHFYLSVITSASVFLVSLIPRFRLSVFLCYSVFVELLISHSSLDLLFSYTAEEFQSIHMYTVYS